MTSADRLAEASDLWTGYECLAGTWFAMYCNVDLDQTERANRPEVVWVRNSAAVVTAPPVDIERCARAAEQAYYATDDSIMRFRRMAFAVLREVGVIEGGGE